MKIYVHLEVQSDNQRPTRNNRTNLTEFKFLLAKIPYEINERSGKPVPPRSLTRTFVDTTKLMHRKKSSSFEVVWSSAVAQWLIRDRGVAASSLSGVTAF